MNSSTTTFKPANPKPRLFAPSSVHNPQRQLNQTLDAPSLSKVDFRCEFDLPKYVDLSALPDD